MSVEARFELSLPHRQRRHAPTGRQPTSTHINQRGNGQNTGGPPGAVKPRLIVAKVRTPRRAERVGRNLVRAGSLIAFECMKHVIKNDVRTFSCVSKFAPSTAVSGYCCACSHATIA